MGVFDELIRMMLEMGVFQVIFPWLIVMSITYGALEKYEYFEDEMVNSAIALSLGFLTSAGMVLFVPPGLFTNLMAAIAFLAVGMIGIVVLAAIGGFDFNSFDDADQDNPLFGLAMVMVPLIFIAVFLYQFDLSGLIPTDTGQLWSDAIMPVLTMVFILLLVVFTAGGGNDDE